MFEREPFGALERLVTQKLLEVSQRVTRESTDETWLRRVAQFADRTDEQIRITVHEFLKTDVFTLSVNLAGLPAISLPCGLSEQGLPLGLQLIAGLFREETILRAGHAFQGETDFHRARPPLAGRGEES